jgi:hypothetical protein
LMCESSEKSADYNSLLNHLQLKHGEVVEKRYLRKVADMCLQKTLELPAFCPVCNLSKDDYSGAFIDHLAECILEFSFLALPFARLRCTAGSSDKNVNHVQEWITGTDPLGNEASERLHVPPDDLEDYRQEDGLVRDWQSTILYSQARATQRTPSDSDHSIEQYNYFDDRYARKPNDSDDSDDSMSKDDSRLRFWRVRNIKSLEKDFAMEWLQEQAKEQGATGRQGFSLAADSERTLCATLTSHKLLTPGDRSWHIDKDFIGFTTLCDPEDAKVDIVAIAGFGRHALGSFCSADGTTVWLRDFAPQDIPQARFVTYGYEPAFDENEDDQGIHDLARTLLDKLIIFRQRTHTQRRPLIFVCHSLGGVILKEAMVISSRGVDSKDEALHRVATQTYGIVLMGVPHLGLQRPQLDTLIEGRSNENLVKDLLLTPDGESPQFLGLLAREFSKLDTRRESPFKIISYHETLETPMVVVSVLS